MLQNFKNKPRHIKLDKHAGMPSVKTLEEMRQKSLANGGALVELPFGNETGTLILTISREASKGSWLWNLYVDDGFGSKMDWSYVSLDANYIHALIGNSHPEMLLKSRSAGMPESQATPNQDAAPSLRKGTLEGNLKNIQITNLLQSVMMGQMTGRLEIISANDRCTILFMGGKPIHATLRGAEGNEALIQLFAWEDGQFSFYDEAVSVPVPSVTRGLTGLMMEGATFVDHFNFLKERGLSHEAYPIRVEELRSQEELVHALKGGVDCNIDLIWELYRKINGTSNWADIARTISAKKTEWVPAVFNLVSFKLIRFDQQAHDEKLISTTGKIDWSIILPIKNSMRRGDTGLCTYAALLYALEQEYYRYESFELPFSLIIFGYCLKGNGSQNEPPQFIPFKTTATNGLREKVFKMKKKYDLLCHYGAFNYGMVLPLTVRDNGRRFADILAEICGNLSVTEQYDPSTIEFRAGMANIPEDCQSLEEMISLAEQVRSLSG
jgi:hypothetical protein